MTSHSITMLSGSEAASSEIDVAEIGLRPTVLMPRGVEVERDRALWSLLDGARPGTELTLAYRLDSVHGVSARLRLSRSTRAQADSDHAEASALPGRDTQRQAARLALPGFEAADAELQPALAYRDMPTPAESIALPRDGAGRSFAPGPKPLQVPEPRLLIAPRPLALRVGDALAALLHLGVEAELELTVCRKALPAQSLRYLAEAKRHLAAQILSPETRDKVHADAVRRLATIERLNREALPLSVRARLGQADPPETHLVGMVAGLLFDAAPKPVARADAIDLSDRVAEPRSLPSLAAACNLVADLARHARPRRVSGDMLELGQDERDAGASIGTDDLAHHLYAVGATGVGKTTLLARLIRQDIAAGRGTCLIDPHGDLYREVSESLSPEDRARTVFADVSDFASPFSLDFIAVEGAFPRIRRSFICNQLIAMFKDLYGANRDAFGPMAEARKFGLSLVLANQSVAQVDRRGPDIAHAILANAGSLLAFRTGPRDAALLGDWLGSDVDPALLTDLPNHCCVARLLSDGRPAPPFVVWTGR